MMTLDSFWHSLEATPVGQFVQTSEWAFPTIECVHVIAIVTVVGTIAVMDIRLLGLASGNRAVTAMSRDTVRWTWGAFVIAAISGLLLFVSRASSYAVNPWFLLKLSTIVVAGLNMMVFNFITSRNMAEWDSGVAVPRAAKIAGAVSLLLWLIVIFFGRAVGFTLDVPT
jgi:hypothetical protein